MPRPVGMTQKRLEVATRAYKLRTRAGLGWKEIGAKLGKTRSCVFMSTRKYALDHDLPWPTKRWSRGRMLYELFEEGMTTRQIIKETGIQVRYPSGISNYARSWAKGNGKPWPIAQS